MQPAPFERRTNRCFERGQTSTASALRAEELGQPGFPHGLPVLIILQKGINGAKQTATLELRTGRDLGRPRS